MLEDVEPGIGFRFADDQRRADANAVLARSQEEAAVAECQLHDRIACRTGWRLALLVGHQFYADHQPAPAYVADDLVFIDPRLHAVHDVLADFRRVVDRAIGEHVHRRQRRSDADWITPER